MSDRIIVVDWGTTAFRAYLVDADSGACLDRITSGQGMRELAGGSFADYCRERLGDWRRDGAVPVYLAGMVGARQGWHEAPQPALPVTAGDLADGLTAAPGLDNTWLVPGVRLHGDGGHVDVMRGEEVQIVGALALAARGDATLCLPGTHSKWARVGDGTLRHFATVMTGELFEAVTRHTLIGVPAADTDTPDGTAFRQGLAESGRPGGLGHQLFTARSRWLYGELAATGIRDYVSGLLIGNEIRGMRGLYAPEGVVLVADGALRPRYEAALGHFGLDAHPVAAADASLAGVLALARRHRRAGG
ncbi:putative 2-dehydro-3-deoxygalactonokinase DgoK1 [wastewater metagenome]|uniref:Putative 2-dehydro-3-deoxygalactonokinase DgoK1 n=2 Tax=unclassified sequences TaxID=12908 RepID=A0A5B8RFB9_9ZZZZ|nr:2-dehydro-3-deoxygalactonokinase [Arhodomonas sp. KWT]QEA06232.1 putative 2-dehydro-3-deoxygalactonokinase DgoK1 [uncultured organism]